MNAKLKETLFSQLVEDLKYKGRWGDMDVK